MTVMQPMYNINQSLHDKHTHSVCGFPFHYPVLHSNAFIMNHLTTHYYSTLTTKSGHCTACTMITVYLTQSHEAVVDIAKTTRPHSHISLFSQKILQKEKGCSVELCTLTKFPISVHIACIIGSASCGMAWCSLPQSKCMQTSFSV